MFWFLQADKTETKYALEVNITRVIDEMSLELLEKLVPNCSDRKQFLRTTRGVNIFNASRKTAPARVQIELCELT